jgi:hypothetical protein
MQQAEFQGQRLENATTAMDLADRDGSLEQIVSARVQAALQQILGGSGGM